jgi:hypothetical protein
MRAMRSRQAYGALLALAAIGCSGTAPSPITGAPPDDGGSPVADARVDHASNEDGSGYDAPGGEREAGTESGGPLPYFGKVQFLRTDQAGNTAYDVLGQFLPTGTWRSALACPPGADTSGACCFIADGGDAGANPYESESAGTLTIALGGTPFASLTYDAQQMQYSTFVATDPPAMTSWSGGDVLQVSASGATVQAFSGSVVMPAPLQGLSVSPTVVPTISLSKDWSVTWTPGPGSTSKVMVLLFGGGGEVKCVVDEGAGSVTVPATLLGRLQPSGGSDVWVESVSLATVPPPNGNGNGKGNATVEIGAFNQVFSMTVLEP